MAYEVTISGAAARQVAGMPLSARAALAGALQQLAADPWAGEPYHPRWSPEFRTITSAAAAWRLTAGKPYLSSMSSGLAEQRGSGRMASVSSLFGFGNSACRVIRVPACGTVGVQDHLAKELNRHVIASCVRHEHGTGPEAE